MKMDSVSFIRHVVSFLLVSIHLTKGDRECECSVVCSSDLKSNLPLMSGYYYSNGDCVQLTSNCSLSHSDCVFTTVTACQSMCVKCVYGCCPDGSSRSKDGLCVGDTSSAGVAGDSLAVRWDVVSIGTVGSLLALSLLLIGGVAIHYRRKQGQRKRSRYIHEVLQMYDGSSDSLSDISIEDNPESNNLFERL